MASCSPADTDEIGDRSEGQLPDLWDEDDDEGEGLDPRVQGELESLNSASESINKLENEVQKARAKFRLMKSECTQRLYALQKKISRKWIIKSRPYFDLLSQSHKAQQDAQRATMKFQKANGVYRAAKETVTIAEKRLTSEDGDHLAFDSAWQEMLNHATMKFMEAEKEKAVCELEHETRAKEYTTIQSKLNFLLKDIPRTINRAKPFYDLKESLQSRLQTERQNAEDLHLALICSKQKYKIALNSLESISDEVHNSRRIQLPLWRTPGVGAEADTCSELSEMPSANIDFMSETSSQMSYDDFTEDGSWSPRLDVDMNFDDEWNGPETPTNTKADAVAENGPWAPETANATTDADAAAPTIGKIWTRLGNGLMRAAQEFGKAPTMTTNGGTASRANRSVVGTTDKADAVKSDEVAAKEMVRDDTVEGAEESESAGEELAKVSSLSLKSPSSSAKSSSPRDDDVREKLVVQQMSVANLGARALPSAAVPKTIVAGKPPLPGYAAGTRTVSVSALKSGVYDGRTTFYEREERSPKKMSNPAAASEIDAKQRPFPILEDLKSANETGSTSSSDGGGVFRNVRRGEMAPTQTANVRPESAKKPKSEEIFV